MAGRVSYKILIGFGALLLIASVLWFIPRHWFSDLNDNGVDPTTQAFQVTLHNDSDAAVVVYQCGITCATFHTMRRLSAGEDLSANASANNVDNYWEVKTVSGGILGCLDLKYDHKIPQLIVDTSVVAPCPKS